MTSANSDPYLEFVEKVINALEDLIHAERHPIVDDFADQLDETIAAILDFHKKDGRP